MKSSSSPPALARHVALALVAFGLTASCTNDEIIAYQDDDPDSGTITPVVDGSTPPPTPDSGPGPRCGDGTLNPGEECDDGNAVSGDGCSIVCKVEATTVLPEDACPGGDLPLVLSGNTRAATVTGTNAGLNPNYETTCGGGNGKDAIYKISSDRPGRAVARLTSDFAGILSLRGNCDPAANTSTCVAASRVGDAVEMVFPLAEAQTVFLVVDALAGGTGNYTLTVDVTDSSCGDGVAQLPEQCDDGNAVNGDGCTDACQLDDPPSLPGTCPGASYTLVGNPAAPVTVSFAGDTSNGEHTSSASQCTGNLNGATGTTWSSGHDQVYAFTPTLGGTLKTTLYPQYGRVSLHARTECFLSGSEVDCKRAMPAEPIELSFPVVANQTYFVFADSGAAGSSSGPSGGRYTLDATLIPPTCGDGLTAGAETCDDGNVLGGDGCSATCTLEPSLPNITGCAAAASITFSDGPNDTRTFHTVESTARLTPSVFISCGISPSINPGQRLLNDAVYSFVAPYDGLLEAVLDAQFNAAMELRRTCIPITGTPPPLQNSSSAACQQSDGGRGVVTVREAVAAGQQYWLVVKGGGNANNAGLFDLDMRLRPGVCGNGIREGVEQCDDGPWEAGYANTSGCLANCTIAPPATTGSTCLGADDVPLIATGAGQYTGLVKSGNWNRRNVTGGIEGCTIVGGFEHYLKVTAPFDGVLSVSTSGTYPTILAARASCAPLTTSNTLAASCIRNVTDQKIVLPVAAGQTVFFVVDAVSSVDLRDKGRFDFAVALAPPTCGDALVSGSEQCDDGNGISGDGCSATCQLEPSPDSDVCEGRVITLTAAAGGTYVGTGTVSTADAAANYAGTCGGSGRDRVVQVLPPITGTMTVNMTTAGWVSYLYARETCLAAATQVACIVPNLDKPNLVTRTATIEVSAGQPVFLFADGNAGQSGPATFQIVITP